MLYDHKLARERIARFVKSVVEPARFVDVAPLEMAVYQCAEPCSYETARAATYKPVQIGWHWGPLWSTAWFRMTGRVPGGTPADGLCAFIDTGTEACLWKDGVPYHGLSRYHRYAPLDASFVQGGRVELMVEAAANLMFGLEGWKPKFPGEELGLLTEARLVRAQPEVEQLYHDLSFALNLSDQLDAESPRRRQLVFALNAAVNALDPRDVPGTAAAARGILRPELAAPARASAPIAHAMGHAHIDTAWLWPLRETHRKCYRTFATVLRNMERFPEYTFQQGQAQLYQFIKEDHPKLFEAIRQRVKEGRWDAAGANWVEPDCNMPSGESLVRQILHATRFWRDELGVPQQTYFWVPDTFGYSAALPQILTQAGLKAFFTQKICWNQFDRFPHHTFWWAALDGTKVLAHFLPADNYNAECTPRELRYGQRNFKQSDRCRQWLCAYGYGDGGGGPSPEMIELLRRSADCEDLPRVRMTTITLAVEALLADAHDLPTWDGELYFEYHRGTLTTQAANKRDNRKAELALRDAEILHALSPAGLAKYPAAVLDACWKTVLLNQFHDILPGSSIGWVYKDTAEQYARVQGQLAEITGDGLRAWAGAADTSGAKNPVVAVNTLGWSRTEVVELPAERGGDGQCVFAPDAGTATPVQRTTDADGKTKYLALLRDVDPLGHRVFDVGAKGGAAGVPAPVKATARSLENEWIRVELDDLGRITALLDKRNARQVLRPGEPANQFVLYEDRPNANDAWDIDIFYLEKARPVTTPAKMTLVESGPLRGTIRIEREVGGHSKLVQHVRLTAASPRLDFDTWIDWHGDQELLRVLFPVDLRAHQASYHVQFGYLQRTTHFNTSWDYGHFECCGHHWCDLSEPDYGVALLSDCKYGYSCHKQVLGLSLLRAPYSPDPDADRGEHRFTYSLLPHAGDLRTGVVVQAGYQLNVPLRVVAEKPHRGDRGPRFSALTCEQPNIVIDTVKKADEDGRIIVRMYEAWGQRGPTTLRWDAKLGAATPVDLLEREGALANVEAAKSERGRFEWRHRPFGVTTVAIK